MRPARSQARGGSRGLAVTVVAGLLALSGATCLGIVVTQRHDPQPPLSTPASPRPPDPPASPRPPDPPASPRPPDPSGSRQSPAETATTPLVGPVLQASAPVALTIPAIGVKSPLLRLGQTSDGSMEVPAPGPRYDEAGWYRYSPTPGSLGPAVIVGHLDSATDGPSVFARLGSLRPGDKVRVKRVDGSIAVFAVDDVRRFRKARFPTKLVYGNTKHAALRLITCGGPLGASGHYLDNIVVRASLIQPAA